MVFAGKGFGERLGWGDWDQRMGSKSLCSQRKLATQLRCSTIRLSIHVDPGLPCRSTGLMSAGRKRWNTFSLLPECWDSGLFGTRVGQHWSENRICHSANHCRWHKSGSEIRRTWEEASGGFFYIVHSLDSPWNKEKVVMFLQVWTQQPKQSWNKWNKYAINKHAAPPQETKDGPVNEKEACRELWSKLLALCTFHRGDAWRHIKGHQGQKVMAIKNEFTHRIFCASCTAWPWHESQEFMSIHLNLECQGTGLQRRFSCGHWSYKSRDDGWNRMEIPEIVFNYRTETFKTFKFNTPKLFRPVSETWVWLESCHLHFCQSFCACSKFWVGKI